MPTPMNPSPTVANLVDPVRNRYPASFPMTPLIPIQLSAEAPVIWCKLEFLNPSGSTKDRIARYILGNALQRGKSNRAAPSLRLPAGPRASPWRWFAHNSVSDSSPSFPRV